MDLTVQPFGMRYCVYIHTVDGAPMYIGSGTLARAFAVGENDRNDTWKFESRGKDVRVKIVAFFNDRRHALSFENALIDELDPPWNGKKYRVAAHRTRPPQPVGAPRPVRTRSMLPVRCNETGEIFETGLAAAKALGVSQGAVSNVLNGRYASVKGLTFSRVMR